VVWRWDTDPFGAAAPNTNPGGLGVFNYNLRLPGQYADAETSLNYNYFRDYDPATGQYVESDPIGFNAGSMSTYSYVRGNPVSFMDPLGLFGAPEHISITNTALGGDKSFPWLAVKVAQVDALHGSQDPANAYWHAMRDGTRNQTVSQAQALYNQYLSDQIASCTEEGLARALHAAEDSAARGHRGFQPWFGGLPSFKHFEGDFKPTQAEIAAGVANAQAVLSRYKAKCACQH
jgi:RHS repeat-associated protein